MRFGGVPFEWIERLAAGSVRRGAPLDQLLADSLIERPQDSGREPVIRPSQQLLFCLNAVVAGQDAAHHLARNRVSHLCADIGVRLFLGCSTLEDAILAIARMYQSTSSPIRIALRTEEETASVVVSVDADDRRESALIEEVVLVWLFMHVLRFLGRAPAVRDVTLRDPIHFAFGRRHWGIGAWTRCDSVTSFSFPRALLSEAPVSHGGPNVMWECQERWLTFLQETQPDVRRFVEDGAFVRFGDLARDSGVSPNTLRRRIKSADGGFRALRQKTLVDATLERLRTTSDSVETIAAELGYSDARSLRRFLKSATGLTPLEVRMKDPLAATRANAPVLERIKTMSAAFN